MPHQCTDCGRVFDDGSTEMLSGCPDCGGTTFQFRPAGWTDDPEAEFGPTDPPDPPDQPGGSVASTVGDAAATVRDLVGASDDHPRDRDRDRDRGAITPEDGAEPTAGADETGDEDAATPPEDAAQADARSAVVGPEELPDSGEAETTQTDDGLPSDAGTAAGARDPSNGEGGAADGSDRPDLAQLREELNDQFESIRIVKPGQYELNLMELYDREEYIVALREDGKYSIQVPETTWKD